jgi:putative copper export protein
VAGSVCALALAATPAFHGHAFGAPEYRLQAVAADVAHVVASGLWVGTLAVLAVTWFPRGTPAQVARVVPRFSGMALIGAAVLGATGVFAGWLHVRTVDLLFASSYGWLLLAKVAAVGVTAGIGAYNWKRVTPRLHEQAGVWRLRRSALAEVLVAALALALTAVLVATALPGE